LGSASPFWAGFASVRYAHLGCAAPKGAPQPEVKQFTEEDLHRPAASQECVHNVGGKIRKFARPYRIKNMSKNESVDCPKCESKLEGRSLKQEFDCPHCFYHFDPKAANAMSGIKEKVGASAGKALTVGKETIGRLKGRLPIASLWKRLVAFARIQPAVQGEFRACCGKCRGHIAFAEAALGMETKCPHCGNGMTLKPSRLLTALRFRGAAVVTAVAALALTLGGWWLSNANAFKTPLSEMEPEEVQRVADNGRVDAQFQLAEWHYEGKSGFSRDLNKAKSLYQAAADGGHSEAQRKFGNMLLNGEAGDKNYALAKTYFTLSSEQGNPKAIHQIGYMHQLGLGGATDVDQAIYFYERSAKHGNVDSMFNLGTMLLDKELGPVNPSEGVKWLKKVAEKNDGQAMCFIGIAYCEGNGVRKDLSEGFQWLKKSADLGYANAQNSVGAMLYDGALGKRDPSGARRYFLMAAKQGDKTASDNLRMMENDRKAQVFRAALSIFSGGGSGGGGNRDSNDMLGVQRREEEYRIRQSQIRRERGF
jgi:TPR repeat protein/protein-arginine kinase activator protein McsA